MNCVKRCILKQYEKIGRRIGYQKIGALRNFVNIFRSDYYFADENDLSNVKSIYMKITTKSEYETLTSSHNHSVLNSEFTNKIMKRNGKRIIIKGECGACGSKYGFLSTTDVNNAESYREFFGCVACRRVRRERVILEKIRELYEKGKSKIYMYETGENLEFVKTYAPDSIGSEYISSDLRSGDIVNSILHEDAHDLSFDDESFDVVVSRDVYEHISDPHKCLKEAFRVLKSEGGMCCDNSLEY